MSASRRTDAKYTRLKERSPGDILKTADGRWLPEVLAGVEKRLADAGASPDFDHLVGLGCRRDDLFSALLWIGPFAELEDTQAALTGFSRSRLKTVLNRMRACADEVEVLLGLGHSQSLLSGGPPSDLARELPLVPTNLRIYAGYVEAVSADSSLRPRSSFTRNIGKAHLVMLVKSVTGRYCDKEVSGLISAVLDRPAYHAQTHRQWRHEHSKEMSTPLDKYFAKCLGRTSKSSPISQKRPGKT
jgi:hypothetical protein